MPNVTSYILKKVKTRFGEMTIPLLKYNGVFNTNFVFDVGASLHPLADGISVLAVHDNISPFSNGVVYKGRLDQYTVYTAPFTSLGINNTAVFVRSSNNEINQNITWGNSGENTQAAIPTMIGIDNNNQMMPIPTAVNINALSSYIPPTATSFGFAASQTYNPNFAGRQRRSQRVIDLWTDFFNVFLTDESVDPYSPGGASTHGGGGRSFDNTSDPVALPSLPADPVLNSGFVTMYQMDVLKLNSLANFLWDASLFNTETWQKVMANPFDAIISLNYIPASPNVLSDRSIQIGNVTTNVSAAPVADQFVQIDCQTLDVEEYGGTYLDYNPYTKVEIYLPYIGFRDLNTDEVMDKTLHLIYNVDIVTGTCVANILVDNTVLYQFTGNCALSIPLTGRDVGKNFAALLSLISAGAVVGAGAYSGTLDAAGAVKAVSATAQAVMGAKRNIQRSGSVSGAAGFMGGQTPYLIITRPRQALPESQNSFTGYPSFITENLSDLAGFTTIESIHLEGIPGTSAEIAEIESLLSSGVIL